MECWITVVHKESQCAHCACSMVCDIYKATGGVSRCEHFYEKRQPAQWIRRKHDDGYGGFSLWHCSRCDGPSANQRNYCAECGAEMELILQVGE